jgi:hypothetical protein
MYRHEIESEERKTGSRMNSRQSAKDERNAFFGLKRRRWLETDEGALSSWSTASTGKAR